MSKPPLSMSWKVRVTCFAHSGDPIHATPHTSPEFCAALISALVILLHSYSCFHMNPWSKTVLEHKESDNFFFLYYKIIFKLLWTLLLKQLPWVKSAPLYRGTGSNLFSEKTISMWVPGGCLKSRAEYLLLMFELTVRIGGTQHVSLAVELVTFLSKHE